MTITREEKKIHIKASSRKAMLKKVEILNKTCCWKREIEKDHRELDSDMWTVTLKERDKVLKDKAIYPSLKRDAKDTK